MLANQLDLFEVYLKDRSNIRVRNEIVKENMGLVKSRAKLWAQKNPQYYDDFVQVGAMAMTKCLSSYDGRSKFSGYATYAIDNAIKNFLRDFGYSPIRRPRRHYDIIEAERIVTTEFVDKNKRKPTNKELEALLKKRMKVYTPGMHRLAKEGFSKGVVYSLDYLSGNTKEENLSFYDRVSSLVADDSWHEIAETLDRESQVALVTKLVNELPLPPRAKAVFFAALDGADYDQIVQELGIKRTTARAYNKLVMTALKKKVALHRNRNRYN